MHDSHLYWCVENQAVRRLLGACGLSGKLRRLSEVFDFMSVEVFRTLLGGSDDKRPRAVCPEKLF